MPRRLPLLALARLAASSAAFAPAPLFREPKPGRLGTDEAMLQGTWEVSYSAGSIDSQATAGQFRAVYEGERLTRFQPRERLLRRVRSSGTRLPYRSRSTSTTRTGAWPGASTGSRRVA